MISKEELTQLNKMNPFLVAELLARGIQGCGIVGAFGIFNTAEGLAVLEFLKEIFFFYESTYDPAMTVEQQLVNEGSRKVIAGIELVRLHIEDILKELHDGQYDTSDHPY